MPYDKEYYRKWAMLNKEYRSKYFARWRKKNRKKLRENDRRYRLRLKERSLAEVEPLK